MSKSSHRMHFKYLDGLRGIAALFVVLYHLWQFVITRPDLGQPPGWFKVLSMLKLGPFAVSVFIVLSGYCLMLPIARLEQPALAGGLAQFIQRRARRILPAYYAALAASIGLVIAAPGLRAPTGSQWDIALPALTPASILTHITLTHNLFEEWQWTINPPLWSAALEWQIYFVFALALLAIWRRGGPIAALGAAYGLGLLPILFGMSYLGSWFLGLFAIGMIAAAINVAPSPAFRWLRSRAPWGVIAGAAGLSFGALILMPPSLVHLHSAIMDSWVGVATAALLIKCTSQLLQHNRLPPGLGFLSSSVFVGLGRISYSLYLTHYPIIALVFLLLLPRGFGPVGLFAALLLVGLPVMLGVAYAMYRAFERPLMRPAVSGQAIGNNVLGGEAPADPA